MSKKNHTKSTKASTAFITGLAGQDGSYLAELLLKKGYKVFGLVKKGDRYLKNIPKGVEVFYGNLGNPSAIRLIVSKSRPDEVYNLAGISDLKTAFKFPEKTMDVNFKAVCWLLGECLKVNPNVKFLQASSSEIFKQSRQPLSEKSARNWQTDNPYARAKMEADRYLENIRKNKNTFACSAILFNHESPRRPDKFVTRKITSTLSKIKLGLAECLELGNLDARRDWGFAGDYVEAMWRILQTDLPDDFIIATGEAHSIKEFIETACNALSMKISWRDEGIKIEGVDQNGQIIVKINPDFYRPTEKYPKVGDITKAKTILQWAQIGRAHV